MIYFDNAATTKVRPEVIESMLPVLSEEYGNPSSLYAMGRSAHSLIEKARKQVASAIGAKLPREIFFTSCGTESDNWAITGAMALAKGKHMITSMVEHHAVLTTCERLEEQGFSVSYVKPDKTGRITAEAVAKEIREDTALISIMYANNEVGTVNEIAAIGKLAREHGILFHTDAVQAAGHLPIDVEAENIDLLSISAHKFHAPKGVGALYIRDGVNIAKLMRGGAQERNQRPGTENTASITAMGTALSLAVSEMQEETARIGAMREHLEKRIFAEIPDVYLNGNREHRLPGTLNLRFPGAGSDAVLLSLDMEGLAASGGSACSAGAAEASHVLLAMGLSESEAKHSIRLSLGHMNTMEEVDQAVEILKRVVLRIRSISPVY
ncbi:MAG: cysteine desulfurase [Christensenellaceae bacterium]|nr:cysteine desulfurase [Christensenellaceae bacterium]